MLNWSGLFVGSTMLALSITGILWRIDAVSVSLSVLASLVASLLLSRHLVRLPLGRAPHLLLLLPLLVIPTLGAFAPPHHWDEVAYGATLPRDYARAGRFFYNADYGPFSALPANYEAITTASLVLTGTVAPARLLNVALAFVLAIAAMRLSVSLGVPKLTAPIAGVFVLSSSALQAVLLIAKPDVASAFFQTLGLVALVDYTERRNVGRLALCGFFLGTALGTKYSSLHFAACLALPIAVLVFRGARTPTARLRHAFTFGVVAVAAALPWYARNFTLFGNPLYPFFNGALGAGNAFTEQHSALAREMFDSLIGYSWHAGTLRTFLQTVGSGFGWVPFLLSFPGLVLATTRSRSESSSLVAWVYASFGILTLLAGYWRARYFLTLLLLASVFATVCLAEVVRRLPALGSRRRMAAAVVTALALLVGATSIRGRYASSRRLIADLYGRERAEFLEAHAPHWELAEWLNHNTVVGDKVAMGLNVQPFYYLERPYFNLHPLTEKGNFQGLDTADEYLRAFRELGIRWVAYKRWRPGNLYLASGTPNLRAFSRRSERALASLHRDGRIELMTQVGAVRVYRIGARLADGNPSGGRPKLPAGRSL